MFGTVMLGVGALLSASAAGAPAAATGHWALNNEPLQCTLTRAFSGKSGEIRMEITTPSKQIRRTSTCAAEGG